MKCKECHFAKRGFFEPVPEAYVCIGGVKPVVITNYPDAVCRNEKLRDIPYKQFMEEVEELRRNHLHSELQLQTISSLTSIEAEQQPTVCDFINTVQKLWTYICIIDDEKETYKELADAIGLTDDELAFCRRFEK